MINSQKVLLNCSLSLQTPTSIYTYYVQIGHILVLIDYVILSYFKEIMYSTMISKHTKYPIPNTPFKIHNAKHSILNTQYQTPHVNYIMPNTPCQTHHTKYTILIPNMQYQMQYKYPIPNKPYQPPHA